MPKCPMSYHSQFDELNFEPFLLPNEVFFTNICQDQYKVATTQKEQSKVSEVGSGKYARRRFVAKNCEIFWQEFQLQTPIFCHFANQSG